MTALSAVLIALALVGSIYVLVSAFGVRVYLRRASPVLSAHPGVTILKPLRGTEAALYDNLASFCAQDYAGPVQILFGVQEETDPAVALVRGLIAEHPGRDLRLVIGGLPRASNRKVAVLANLARHIAHEVVVVADSDIGVGPGYLSTVVAHLLEPNVGLVTCLYRGRVAGGIWARLAAMAIDYQFMPSVIVGLRTGLARPCFGSTIALRRETLAAVGGFETFTHYLADDYALGEAVRRVGLDVRIPGLVVDHTCIERDAGELLGHELRWARTIRAVDAWGFAGSVLTHPVPLALLAATCTGFGTAGLSTLAVALASRLALQLQVDRTVHSDSGRWWLGPLRDVLSFLVFAASFFVGTVSWRGDRYKVRADGTLVRLERGVPLGKGSS